MFFVLGQIFDNTELVGYRVLSLEQEGNTLNREVKDVSLEKIRLAFSEYKNVPFINAYYKEDSQLLIGTYAPLTNYQRISKNGILLNSRGKKKVCVVYEIINANTKEVVGYGITDSYGMLLNVTNSELLKVCNKYDAVNFELVTDKSGVVVKSLGDAFMQVPFKDFNAIKGYNSKLGETYESINPDVCSRVVDSHKSNILPTIEVYSYNDIDTGEIGISAQNKLAIAYDNMRKITPFYYTILMSLHREVNTAIGTMGVTESKLYYNSSFVATLTVPQLTYVLIHEVLHIAGRHSVRHGNKDNELWNIACDLYINSLISHDFDCYYSGGVRQINSNAFGTGSIEVPSCGIHLSTINETLDFGVDTPETIYKKLVEENPDLLNKQNNSGQGSGQGQGQSSSSSQSSGQGQSSNSSQSNSQGKGQNSSDSQGQGSSQKINIGGNPVENDGSFSADVNDVDQSGDYKGLKKVSVKYNGKVLSAEIPMDVIASKIIKTEEDAKEVSENALDTTQAMKTAIEIQEDKTGKKLSGRGGEAVTMREIEFGLSKIVNWKVLLKNVCKSKPKKMYTLGSPNEVYLNNGVTVASRRKIGKPETISGIKVCIDVSGSVSDEELKYFLSEVANIFTYYDVEGELIYWSTKIGNAGKFKNISDMMKVSPDTDGGTDVRCVFDYLSGKTRVNSKFQEDKVKDIKCVIVITDGCFNNNIEDYARKFGNRTIWIITDGRKFDAPFGLVSSLYSY